MKFVRSWKEARISAYQVSSKTLTFWVVAIVFLVSAAVGQAQTPQALSAASYVATATKLVCVAQTRALCGSAAVCADLANGCLFQDSQWSTGSFTAADRQKTPVCATRFCFLGTSQHTTVSILFSASQEKSRLREYLAIELGLSRGSIGESLLH